MKNLFLTIPLAAFALVSCEKPGGELETKLKELEQRAADSAERQRQLESELAEQKLIAELEAIERERTLIEEQRLAMENELQQQDTIMAAELEKRQQELAERERQISETREELDARQQELTGLEAELNERELENAGYEPIPSLPVVRNYVSGLPTGDFDNFYEPLQNYGSWFNTTDYGYVFQPTVVHDTSWRPYTRGRWAFTNQGWTWVSNEPFGWACYHYGRWALLRNVGWVWVPGDTWAPAWVTWRESPGHIGWAPLPPETLAWRDRSWDSSVEVNFGIGSSWFSFVSYDNFGNNIQPHCLPVARNVTIIRQTTNITHYRIDNRRIFVGGPRYRNVCDRIGRPFPIHHLRMDENPRFERGRHRLNNHFSGRDLEVVAPRMGADWNAALRPERVRRNLGDVSVERSRELPEEVRQRFRERRRAENHEAERVVADAGGREGLERFRRQRLEQNRDREPREIPGNDPGVEPEAPVEPPAEVIPTRPERGNGEARDKRGERRGDRRGPMPVVPEPVIPGGTPDPTPELPTIPAPGENPEIPDLPPGVTPAPGAPETPPGINPPRERPDRRGDERRRQMPRDPVAEVQPEAEPPSVPELHQGGIPERPESGQEALRRQRLEIIEQRKAQLEEARRMARESSEQAAREAAAQTERLMREEQAQETRESAQDALQRKRQEIIEQRKAQLAETQRAAREAAEQAAQREQQMREQQAKQEQETAQRESAQEALQRQRLEIIEQRKAQLEEAQRKRQEEMQRQQQEQQERARQQQEEAARRAQQEEAQRRQQEEMQRQQQEQQERARQQQEEAARRAQQEEAQRRQQEEMQRQQQEQQERARQQQEEARRQQEQQQQGQ